MEKTLTLHTPTRKKQGADLESVNVRIGAENDFAPAKLIDVKRIQTSVVFRFDFYAAAQNFLKVCDDVVVKDFGHQLLLYHHKLPRRIRIAGRPATGYL